MKPQKLILTGFAGILSGRGKNTVELDLTLIPKDAQIVALIGPNGSSKTTLMDNMQPYRVMPSRLNTPTSTPSPGSFSYYDQIAGNEATKDFYWQHNGVNYRSLINIYATGKTQKQEAYLFVSKDGSFAPFTNENGVSSDGKAATYDACVNQILGSPENFFMTQFSAQGKRQIGAHKGSEIKDVLAEMLGTQNMKLVAAQASEVSKSMKTSLTALQTNAIQHQTKSIKTVELEASKERLQGELQASENADRVLEDQIRTQQAALQSKEHQLDGQVAATAKLESIQARIESTNQSWTVHKTEVEGRNEVALREFDERLAHDVGQFDQTTASINSARLRVANIRQQLSQYDATKTVADSKPALLQKKSDLQAKVEDLREKVRPLTQLRIQAATLLTTLTETKTNGLNLASAIEIAKITAALIDEVPCKGTTLQGKCKLLADANQAAIEIPIKIVKKDELFATYRKTQSDGKTVEATIQALITAESNLQISERELQASEVSLSLANQAKKTLDQLDALKSELPALNSSLQDLEKTSVRLKAVKDESKQRRDALVERQTADLQSAFSAVNDRLADLHKELGELPPVITLTDIEADKQALSEIYALRDQRINASNGIKEQIVAVDAALVEARNAKEALEKLARDSESISDEMSVFNLASKAFGNDGILALSIDDAGPEISEIANKLLQDCYEGRFCVRMETQKQTGTGVMKETFEVMVEDTHRGESKTLNSMSGGEKVWVNECLVRAFALYMTHTSGICFQTLFCDESDGALDPERKRQFIAMKRAVLQIGGYEREYMITQTPELWEGADHIIDVTKL